MSGVTRVAWALYRFYQRLRALDLMKNGRVPLPYRQQDLADAVGLSLVHTNKTLTRLREAGVATWQDEALVVHKERELARLGNVEPERSLCVLLSDDGGMCAWPGALFIILTAIPASAAKSAGGDFPISTIDGTRIDCPKKRRELKALAVPPAYTDVWMAPMANAHLLATGRDARTRKQYRYHPDWAAQRAKTKFHRLGDFGGSLPRLRRWVDARLSGEVGEEDTAVAAVLALIDRAALRPGATAYASENRSYGATTLKARHLSVDGDRVELSFKGKGGKKVEKSCAVPSCRRCWRPVRICRGPRLSRGWTRTETRGPCRRTK